MSISVSASALVSVGTKGAARKVTHHYVKKEVESARSLLLYGSKVGAKQLAPGEVAATCGYSWKGLRDAESEQLLPHRFTLVPSHIRTPVSVPVGRAGGDSRGKKEGGNHS